MFSSPAFIRFPLIKSISHRMFHFQAVTYSSYYLSYVSVVSLRHCSFNCVIPHRKPPTYLVILGGLVVILLVFCPKYHVLKPGQEQHKDLRGNKHPCGHQPYTHIL